MPSALKLEDTPIILDDDFERNADAWLSRFEEDRFDILRKVKSCTLACWREIHRIEAEEKDRREKERISAEVGKGLEELKKQQSLWQSKESSRLESIFNEIKSPQVAVFETSTDLRSARSDYEPNHVIVRQSDGFDVENLLKKNKLRLKALGVTDHDVY